MSSARDEHAGIDVPANATYEELAAALEDVVGRLESGELSLDEALAEYERGVELVRRCNDLLDRAELRIAELTNTLVQPAPGRTQQAHLGNLDFFEDDEDDE